MVDYSAPKNEKGQPSDVNDTTAAAFDSVPLLQSDLRLESNDQRQPRPLGRGLLICTIALILWTFVTGYLVIFFFARPGCSGGTPQTRILHCGNSTAEAKALGCKFDVLSYVWIPEPCFDSETLSQYQERETWRGYSEKHGTQLLTLDEMSEAGLWAKHGNLSWSSRRDHVVHCAYMWQRQHKAYLEGGWGMDVHVKAYEHTRHCMIVIQEYSGMTEEELDIIDVGAVVEFSSCIIKS